MAMMKRMSSTGMSTLRPPFSTGMRSMVTLLSVTGLARCMTFSIAPIQASFLDRLHQIIDGIHVECLDRMVTIRSHKHDRRRILKLMQRLGKLQARGTGHRDIEKHDIHATFHKHLDGGADARRLRDRADLARLLEQEAKLRASRRLIIHNHRTQHRDKTFRQLTTPGIRRMTLSP